MSLALINDLSDATARLRQAMQGTDLSAIETATTGFRVALEAVQGVGAWHAEPDIKARIKAVLEELESSRVLACLLNDKAGQMHMAIANRNLDAPQPLYQRAR